MQSTIDIDSNRQQAAGSRYIVHIPHHITTTNLYPAVLTLQFASHMSPGIQLCCAAAFGLFLTNLANVSIPCRRATRTLTIDETPLCAFRFSLFTFRFPLFTFCLTLLQVFSFAHLSQRSEIIRHAASKKESRISSSSSNLLISSCSCSFRPGAD